MNAIGCSDGWRLAANNVERVRVEANYVVARDGIRLSVPRCGDRHTPAVIVDHRLQRCHPYNALGYRSPREFVVALRSSDCVQFPDSSFQDVSVKVDNLFNLKMGGSQVIDLKQ